MYFAYCCFAQWGISYIENVRIFVMLSTFGEETYCRKVLVVSFVVCAAIKNIYKQKNVIAKRDTFYLKSHEALIHNGLYW